MLNSSVIKILQSFSKQEIKDFREFISSPFFNKNENIVKLYNYLKKFYPDFNDSGLEKESVYKSLFGKDGYNDGFMRTLIFNLNNLLEEYLSYINFSGDKVKKGIGLLNEINRRKIGKVFLKTFKETEKLIEATPHKNPEYYINKYALTIQRETHVLWDKSVNRADLVDFFKNSHDNLTHFYLGSILREYRYLLYLKDMAPSEYKSEFLEYILRFLSGVDNEYVKNHYINLHLNEIYLQTEKSGKYFYILKDILKNDSDKIGYADRFSLQNILQIFCIKKGFEGDRTFSNERFELYKIILDQKLYSAMSPELFEDTLFINIVNIGISMKEFDWVNSVIAEFKDKLLESSRNTVVNFSQARLSFAKGKFGDALDFLNLIDNLKNSQLKFPIRTLTLMNLFEMDAMSQIFYQIDSFRHFLAKSKSTLPADRFERIANFLKFFTRLAKLKEKLNQEGLKNLKKDLRDNPNVIERSWLIEKVEVLSG